MLWHFHTHDIFVKQQSDGELVTFTLKSVSMPMDQWLKTMNTVCVWCSSHYPRTACSKDRLAVTITGRFVDNEVDAFVSRPEVGPGNILPEFLTPISGELFWD